MGLTPHTGRQFFLIDSIITLKKSFVKQFVVIALAINGQIAEAITTNGLF
jgi:hypothetical protein